MKTNYIAAIELIEKAARCSKILQISSTRTGEMTETRFNMDNGYTHVFAMHDRELILPDSGKAKIVAKMIGLQEETRD